MKVRIQPSAVAMMSPLIGRGSFACPLQGTTSRAPHQTGRAPGPRSELTGVDSMRQEPPVDRGAAEGHDRGLARPPDEDREPEHAHRPGPAHHEPERMQWPPD